MSVKQPRTRKFMAHEPGFTIIDAMNRLFPAWFDGESCWDAWRVILKPQNPARWRGHLDHLLPKQSKLARGTTPRCPMSVRPVEIGPDHNPRIRLDLVDRQRYATLRVTVLHMRGSRSQLPTSLNSYSYAYL